MGHLRFLPFFYTVLDVKTESLFSKEKGMSLGRILIVDDEADIRKIVNFTLNVCFFTWG